jgi:hypothetical protein
MGKLFEGIVQESLRLKYAFSQPFLGPHADLHKLLQQIALVIG